MDCAPVDFVLGFEVLVAEDDPSETRFFLRGGCVCSILRNESSTMATFLLSRSVGSVRIPKVSNEPWRGAGVDWAGVKSRLGGLLREEPDADAASASAASSKCPSLAALLLVAWPVLGGETAWDLLFLDFFLFALPCILA